MNQQWGVCIEKPVYRPVSHLTFFAKGKGRPFKEK